MFMSFLYAQFLQPEVSFMGCWMMLNMVVAPCFGPGHGNIHDMPINGCLIPFGSVWAWKFAIPQLASHQVQGKYWENHDEPLDGIGYPIYLKDHSTCIAQHSGIKHQMIWNTYVCVYIYICINIYIYNIYIYIYQYILAMQSVDLEK